MLSISSNSGLLSVAEVSNFFVLFVAEILNKSLPKGLLFFIQKSLLGK
jgi:hypothetical protein